jgi:hypothetical protein
VPFTATVPRGHPSKRRTSTWRCAGWELRVRATSGADKNNDEVASDLSVLARRSYRYRMVRPRLTALGRAPFKPGPLGRPPTPLNYRAFNIRTKMAVVRLLRRKLAERDENGPK